MCRSASGLPPEHWPTTRASSARMFTRSPVGAASAWIAGLRSIVPKPGTSRRGNGRRRRQPGEAGQQRDLQLADAALGGHALARRVAGRAARRGCGRRTGCRWRRRAGRAAASPPAVCVMHSGAPLLAVTGSTGAAGPSAPRTTLASQVQGAADAPVGATSARTREEQAVPPTDVASSRPRLYHAGARRTPLSAASASPVSLLAGVSRRRRGRRTACAPAACGGCRGASGAP